FAAFAHEFAARYGVQVDYYQIWDEPNLADHWGGGPVNPPAYADLLARAANAIRAADPGARILLAGLAPTTEIGPQNLSDARYLAQLYQAGAAPYFDIVTGKPYGFDTGPDDRRAGEGVLNFSRLLLLRRVMVEHGDAGKSIWASHWGWNALPPDWTGAPSLWGQTGEATQVTRTVAALERARTEWPWVGAMMLNHFQPAVPLDDPRWGFALLGPGGDPRPLYDAVAAWAAALPDAAPVGGYPARNPWAVYEGDWRVGPLGADVGADASQAVFRFEGARVALTVRRGPYRAFLYVTVDGEPANALPRDEMGRAYVVLYDSAPSVAVVPLATGLSPGPHTVELVAERGRGRWALVDWRVGAAPLRDGFAQKLTGLIAAALALTALLARDARRVGWGALAQRFLAWPEWAQVSLVVGWAGLLWATAGVSWGRDWGSPWLIVSVPVLLALVYLLALRLDLGLALVALTAPFYLHPGDMFYRALSMPELLVILCGLGLRIANCELRIANLQISPIDGAVLLLVAAAGAASVAAADKTAALFELRTIFLLPALYYALLRMARLDDRARRRLVDGFVLGAVGVALIGLAQYALGRNVVIAEGGLPRLQSVYYSPNSAGLYLGRVWPLLLAVVVLPSSAACSTAARRVFYGLALALVTLALALSFSRGALLLGLPAALLVMGWRAGGRYRWAALAIVLTGALALIPLLRVPRFASLLDWQRGSTFFRLELWRSSLHLLREHPLFGVGPGNFLETYRTRYVLPSAWQEFNLEHPHNVYLDHWTRLGLLGLLAGIGIQAVFWRKIGQWSRRDVFALGFAGAMTVLLAHGLVDNTLFFPDLALVFFLTLALA
ncbi:MAG: O-antigen ligase family protein, partial [Chloroflexota bacterium]|nr:O-antigen ligase family protein [Chloroflexota bacterium]